jgi:hypothetical protein
MYTRSYYGVVNNILKNNNVGASVLRRAPCRNAAASGAAGMNVDRFEGRKGLPVTLSRSGGLCSKNPGIPGTMSLGHGGESMAPVFLEASANNGLVRM